MSRYSKKVEALKIKLSTIQSILPGSLSKQWNVCGTKGCKCKDPDNPVRHGPYYQLSFSIKGKSSSMFVKKEEVAEVESRIKRYHEFKKLVEQLIETSIELARHDGFNGGTR